MHAWMDGLWVWTAVVMAVWAVLLAAVLYIAVRLAERPPRKPSTGH